MNRTPTRLLALILALFTILPAAAALTSCGGGSGSETADTTTAGETASGEDTAAEPDPEADIQPIDLSEYGEGAQEPA